MERVPDWAGTPPASVDEFLFRLSTRTRNIISSFKIKSLDTAKELRIELYKNRLCDSNNHINGLGRASLKEIDMAIGIYHPPISDLDTSDCWLCNGKIGNYPNYCSKHCAYLNKMKGSWENFLIPPGMKAKAIKERRSNIVAKAVRRWLKKHKPTIISEKDAEKWAGKFNLLIEKKPWKRDFYKEGSYKFYQTGYFFYEGTSYRVGNMWVNGEMVKILPSAALQAMNEMRRVAERSGRAE
jgi:hypothetical protein